MKYATTILLVAVLAIAVGCGGSLDADVGGSAAAPTVGATPSQPKRPANGDAPRPAAPTGGLAAFRRRCQTLDLDGARARVLYEASRDLTRGRSAAVAAAVSLEMKTPPDQVLDRSGATADPGVVVVSCLLQAQLSASPYDFEIDDTGWVERSLLSSDTARWSWYVKPKVGGTQTLTLRLRPIVKLRRNGRVDVTMSAEDADVQQYETRVHVSVPWTERPQETLSRLAATFKVAESAVEAATLLVTAIIALAVALGIRRRKRKRTGPAEPAPGTP